MITLEVQQRMESCADFSDKSAINKDNGILDMDRLLHDGDYIMSEAMA